MSCVVRGCKSHSSRQEKEVGTVTFHRFPTDFKRRQVWIDKIAQKNWEWKKHQRICSKHFSPQCFININHKWRRLELVAVPSLYLYKESHTMCCNKVLSTSAPPTRATSSSTPSSRERDLMDHVISSSAQSTRERELKNHVVELQEDLEKLRKVSKRRLLKINCLRQKTNRLKTKNRVLNLRLMDLLGKENSA